MYFCPDRSQGYFFRLGEFAVNNQLGKFIYQLDYHNNQAEE